MTSQDAWTSIVGAVEDGRSYSSSRRLWSAVYDVLNAHSIATDTRTQIKANGVSIDISVAVSWWRRRVSGPDHHRYWNMGCTHYPRHQAAVKALASQWISPQDEIQVDYVGAESYVHGVPGQTGSNPRWQTSTSQEYKVSPTVWQMSPFGRIIYWKIAQHLLFLFQ